MTLSSIAPESHATDLPPPHAEERFAEAVRLFALLSSPSRLQVLAVLCRGERFVHEIVSELGISQPRVSQHLFALQSYQLVKGERFGRRMLYRVTNEELLEYIVKGFELQEAYYAEVPRRRHRRKANASPSHKLSGSMEHITIDPTAHRAIFEAALAEIDVLPAQKRRPEAPFPS